MPVSAARKAAFDILLRVERDQAYADELLHSHLNELSIADRALTTEIVMGVLRWRGRLDSTLEKAASRSLGRMDVEVLTALRMGAYQLGWLERVPVRAAVNESVELVKRARKRSAAPLVNAILRKASAVPLENVRGEDAHAVAAALSHPEWLVLRWETEFGLDVTRQICEFDQQVPQTAIRVADEDAERELVDAGVKLAPGKLIASARRVVEGNVARTRAFAEGRVHIQDEASQLVALLVGRGQRVLDCCAAPGGKTRILAERNPESDIVALELHEHRARLLRQRLHDTKVSVITADAREISRDGRYDRVLADVPCSGTGTLARNPEIKWRLRENDLVDLHEKQREILKGALARVEHGGRLVYSTCSLEREECESVVEEVLAGTTEFSVIPAAAALETLRQAGELVCDIESLVRMQYLRTMQGVNPCDGFFGAVIERQ